MASEGYNALRESAAWIDLTSRGRIRMTGEDRARLLHAMTTNHVQDLKPGDSCYLFFLNAQGRILGDAQVLCFEDSFLIDTEPETRRSLYDHLDRYIIADDVALEDVTDSVISFAVEGPRAEQVLAAAGAPIPGTPGAWSDWSGCVARIDTTGAAGFRLFTTPERRDQILATLALPPATAEDARTVRIEHAKPRYGEEITDRYLVQETGQLHAVHFSKGCYLGQEIVERVRSRAQIHRILRPLRIDAKTPPEPGTKLDLAGAEAGEVVSSAYSPSLDAVVAMAYVKTPYAEPETSLSCGRASTTVLTLP